MARSSIGFSEPLLDRDKMLLYLKSKEDIFRAKERLTILGVEHHLLPGEGLPVFEIASEQSIYPPKILATHLMEIGRVEHNGAKSPLLDALSNPSVHVKTKAGAELVFKNHSSPIWIAGPCSLDEEKNLRSMAKALKDLGVHVLRGGAVKPRTSPHEFQGIGRSGYKLLSEVAREEGMASISEAMSEFDVEEACEYLDLIQVGARNMQNYALLKKLGKSNKPILLKRGPGATLREWALAAEYLLAEGNYNVILCERGVRGLERELRYTLDLAGAAFMQHRYGLPIVIDPSHATGVKQIIEACTAGAIAMGFAGVMLEAHPSPMEAKSDSLQALTLNQFSQIIRKLHK